MHSLYDAPRKARPREVTEAELDTIINEELARAQALTDEERPPRHQDGGIHMFTEESEDVLNRFISFCCFPHFLPLFTWA